MWYIAANTGRQLGLRQAARRFYMHRDRQNLWTNVIMAACMEALLTSVISVIHLCFCLALPHWHWHQDESGVLRLGVHTMIQSVTRQGSNLIASVWLSKIYISTVRFTMLAHSPTTDLSSPHTFQACTFQLCYTVSA